MSEACAYGWKEALNETLTAVIFSLELPLSWVIYQSPSMRRKMATSLMTLKCSMKWFWNREAIINFGTKIHSYIFDLLKR